MDSNSDSWLGPAEYIDQFGNEPSNPNTSGICPARDWDHPYGAFRLVFSLGLYAVADGRPSRGRDDVCRSKRVGIHDVCDDIPGAVAGRNR